MTITKARIKIDGYDIKKVKLKDLRRSISFVSQDPTLFNDTVKNNIAYGMNDVPDTAYFKLLVKQMLMNL